MENEQLKVLYEELLKKIEEEGAIKPLSGKLLESDKANETAPITQVNVEQLRSECEQLEKSLESWKVKCNELENELNALKAYCAKLEKDLADLVGWKHKCTELQLRVTQIENNVE